MTTKKIFIKSILLLSLLLTSSCSTVYYNFWETLGKEKRDLLKSKLNDVNNAQEDVEEQYVDNLERIRKEYNFNEGELEKTYDKITDDYEDTNEKQKELSERINKANNIATDLFEEWKNEAYQLQNKNYKRKSLQKLAITKKKYSRTYTTIKKIEKDLNKILRKFKDQVIFIKHNLNAKVIGNLKSEFNDIKIDIKKQIKNIKRSKNQTELFIKELD